MARTQSELGTLPVPGTEFNHLAHAMLAQPRRLPPVREGFVDAARVVLGASMLLPGVKCEIDAAIDGYERRLNHFHSAISHGNAAKIRGAFHRLIIAPSSKLVCYLLANWKSLGSISFAELKLRAARINLCRPSGERVFATERSKFSGGTRWTCAFGPLARAGQKMIDHIIIVGTGLSPYEFAQKGRGREAAAEVALQAIQHKGVRWFGLADVKDFFPSITRKMVRKALPFIPASIVEATVFIHDDWTCNGFVPVSYLTMPPWLRTRAG